MAHVFGDHAPIELGGFTVPHISPETVQDRTHIRVLFAKDAISTGWDCPRAETLVSFRPAKDETHITQLLGRMVRTPLARRVPGNDLLNSVECVLPHFDRSTAARVARTMLGDREHDDDGTGGGAGRRVLLAPVDMDVNQAIPEAVWEAFDALPSQTLPRKAARPVRRLPARVARFTLDAPEHSGTIPGARGDILTPGVALTSNLAVIFTLNQHTTPSTLLRWYRYLIAAKYDGSKNRSPGRPPTAKDIRELMVRMARENPTWEYTRLQGALKNLGYELGRNTIKRVLADHGIAPAPERGKSMSWSTFIKAHGGAIAATDLFTVEVVNPFGLVRYHVLFVIDIVTRWVLALFAVGDVYVSPLQKKRLRSI